MKNNHTNPRQLLLFYSVTFKGWSSKLSHLLLCALLSSNNLLSQDIIVAPKPAPYSDTLKKSYVRTWNVSKPIQNVNDLDTLISIQQARMTTQYLDGLGRPLQMIVKQGSLVSGGTATDLVTPRVYDNLGREVRKYLPFAANITGGNTHINDGMFKKNPFDEQEFFYGSSNANSPIRDQGETYYYGKTEYEASPLDRIERMYAPGNSWVSSNGRGIKMKYWVNKLEDSVRIWKVTNSGSAGSFGNYNCDSMYEKGMLYKTVTIDENNKQVIEFKDKDGLVILKKVQLTANVDDSSGSGYSGWLCTYYIYDNLNQLRAIVQPRGVELLLTNNWNITSLSGIILKEQCFRYEYDDQRRMIMKQVPGAGAIYMIYDVRNRLVFTQDSNMREQNNWLTTLYDNLNRPILTGITIYNGNLSTLQAAVNIQTSTRGDSSAGLPIDLILINEGQSGVKQAMRSIGMKNGFGVAGGTAFSAEIVDGQGVTSGEATFIDGVVVNKYPVPSGATFNVLTNTFYDNYNWCSYYSIADRRTSAYDTYLLNASNNTFPYAQAMVQSDKIKGMVTGTRTKILGTENYLYSVPFYDDKGRTIQVQSTNISGGTDVVITQYSFLGQPLITVQKQEKAGYNGQTTIICTQLRYDSLWRMASIEKKVSNTLVNSGAMPSNWTTIVQYEYDALGQLKKKKIGNKPGASSGTPLVNLDFDYNIRGWLLSINKDYIGTNINNDHYFGMELGYDKNASLGTFAPQYNGNIGGTIWKSEGDQQKRKYDFTYDSVNRLTRADFNQFVSGSGGSAVFDKSAGVDFSMSDLSYDANGNIKSILQKGWKGTSSPTIDSLAYNYISNSNRLQNVIDGANDTQTKLGDFRTSVLHPIQNKTSTTVDYSYDGNGNIVKDLNKDLVSYAGANGIVYNYLNLPQTITVRSISGNKGTIVYTYDAIGNKLKKVVTEGTAVTTTLYVGGLEYKNDTLQQVAQEEGRIRYTSAVGATAAKFDYDYFIKDHLGNVRMVLTEQRQQDVYPAATLEGSLSNNADAIYIESQYYEINTVNVVDRSFATDITAYPNNNGNPPYNVDPNGNPTANSEKLYKLLASSSGGVTGLGLTLKVMSGDTINIFGKSYYFTNNTGGSNYNVPVLDILSGLLGSPSSAAGSKGVEASGLNGITGVYNAVSRFLDSSTRSDGIIPKAYINWVLFDENFKYVTGNFSRVGSANIVKDHYADAALQNIQVTKNGYLYVYCSNESPVAVFFDNLQVVHSHGPILEDIHYYPFGLTMAGISSSALNFGKENKYKFNKGSELQNKEFSDGSGLEIYDTYFRQLDPQLGRWCEIDPKPSESESPYASMSNNPILYNDELGDEAEDMEGPGDPPGRSIWQGIKQGATNFVQSLITPPIVSLAIAGKAALDGDFKPGASLFLPAINKADDAVNFVNGDAQTKAEIITGNALELGSALIGEKVLGGRGIEVKTAEIKIDKPYQRPNNATTPELRQHVNELGKKTGCTKCGVQADKYVAGHKKALVKEYYETGKIDKKRMRSKDAVQPECPTCSAKEGAEMKKYSQKEKRKHGL